MARAYIPPPWILREVGNRLTRLFGNPVLVVEGRTSGNPQEIPINVLHHKGERYLVAPRGETDWVRNVRAAGRAQLKRRRSVEPIMLVELDTADKPDLITAYRQKWDRPTRRQWEALPDPADHPIFRIVPHSGSTPE
ncbi:MAG: nitroreductase/quinone reductase family protein [Acidimicrobiia bacterium]